MYATQELVALGCSPMANELMVWVSKNFEPLLAWMAKKLLNDKVTKDTKATEYLALKT